MKSMYPREKGVGEKNASEIRCTRKKTRRTSVGHSKEYNFDGHESVRYDRKRCRDCIGCDLVSKASLGLRVVAKGGMKTITPYTFDGWCICEGISYVLHHGCMCSRNDCNILTSF